MQCVCVLAIELSYEDFKQGPTWPQSPGTQVPTQRNLPQGQELGRRWGQGLRGQEAFIQGASGRGD